MRLEDVATRAGVAADTARRALRGAPSVRPYIRERVLKAAKDLNYHPNLVARALRDNTLGFVPILAPMVGEMYFGNLAAAIARSVVAAGLQPALCISPEHLLKMSLSFPTRGCILASAAETETIAKLGRNQKVVVIGMAFPTTSDAAAVAIDFDAAYRTLAKTLVLRGRRKIAIVSEFYQTCLDRGWPLQKFPFLIDALRRQGLKPVQPRPGAVFSSGAELAAWIAAHPGSVDAAVCENDLAASQVVGELAPLKLVTPDDVTVVGCDANCKLRGTWSVKLDTAAIAALATATLKKLMDGEAVPESPVYVPELLDEHDQPLAGKC